MSAITSTAHNLHVTKPRAVLGATVIALVVNLILWLIGLALGGSFEMTDQGKPASVAPGGVITLTVVPLLVGLSVAMLISLKWEPIIRIAQIVGAVVALGTIALTIAADFDAASTVTLALMHVVVAASVVVALEAVRRSPSN
ncbi:DUF6069 family protein [Rhodococcus qingshengii]|jgi:hypothetical protein|uniref:DUF6069 family protein n=1 Tax=Rhodococcus TaxID=1827 RepID=UPI00067ED40C|nr:MULTISPECIES: DUF6069 family protein [Rhodococcus]MYV29698.1 hypothetical protein [Rhodococcus erythropolis]AUS31961.1 hypothetical protein C1M55_13155 [Rhodococcus qingshengii]MCC4304459.1 DUF6069 family protein [Rhodococcus sp. 3-2]MCZ4613076.1 DUF6069 family protein [Rhodococcus qingshengii]MDI9945870.1 DUF6069 family protein [Rhodococcus sp. IEGM 1302]